MENSTINMTGISGAGHGSCEKAQLFYRRPISIGLVMSFFLFFTSYLHAQVKVEIDTTKIRIGEQIEYKIVLGKDSVKEVSFPKLRLDSLQKLELVESFDIDSVKNQLFRRYLLTSFDSGRYLLPKQAVMINNKTFFTDSVYIDVLNVEVDTLKQKLYPIKPVEKEPYVLADFIKYLWWLLALLLLIGIILYFKYRKKPEIVEEVDEVPPFEKAKQRLKELDSKNLIQQNRVKLYYVELTDIVRTFIEKEMNIPALESTSDELIETIKDFNSASKLNIPKETILKLKKLLQEADLVKFAKSHPLLNEIELHRQDAERIIEIMHPLNQPAEKQKDHEE